MKFPITFYIIATLLLGFVTLFFLSDFSLIYWLHANITEISLLRESFPLLTISFFILAYILCAILPTPGSIFISALAGYLYGNVHGFILVWSSTLLGACLSFLLSKYFLHEYMQKKYFNKFKENKAQSSLLYLIAARTMPMLPFSTMNIIMAMSTISFKKYFCGTAIGLVPASYLVVSVGGEFVDIHSTEDILAAKSLYILTGFSIFLFLFRWIWGRFQTLSLETAN